MSLLHKLDDGLKVAPKSSDKLKVSVNQRVRDLLEKIS